MCNENNNLHTPLRRITGSSFTGVLLIKINVLDIVHDLDPLGNFEVFWLAKCPDTLTYGHHLRSAVQWLDVHDSSSRGRVVRDDVLEHLGELPHGGVCVHLSIGELSRELKLGLTDL